MRIRPLSSTSLAAIESITVTAAGLALLDDAAASNQLTTLGLTANGASLVTAANYAAMVALLGTPPVLTVYDAYAVGTVYSVTNASAAVDFGTTDPSITIAVAGTYRLKGRINLKYNGATTVAPRTVTIKLRRTNNTAADVANSTTVIVTGIVTTLTQTFMEVAIPEVPYVTALTSDILTIFVDVDTVPSAGSLDVVEASIHALRVA